MCLPAVKFALLSAFFLLKAWVPWKSIVNYGDLRPECNEWRNYKTALYDVQGWGGEQMFIMQSEVVGWPSVMSDELIQNVDQNIC
jgi:hypothetical protein